MIVLQLLTQLNAIGLIFHLTLTLIIFVACKFHVRVRMYEYACIHACMYTNALRRNKAMLLPADQHRNAFITELAAARIQKPAAAATEASFHARRTWKLPPVISLSLSLFNSRLATTYTHARTHARTQNIYVIHKYNLCDGKTNVTVCSVQCSRIWA